MNGDTEEDHGCLIQKSGIMETLAFCLLLIVASGFTGRPESIKSPAGGKEVVLKLDPGNNNPRNSEGDFVTLKDGRILFVYAHYTGTSGSDFGNACLMSRVSADNGKTWSTEDRLVVKQEGLMNVMSVSLLRLQNGEIALFYLRKNATWDCIPMMRISTDEGESWSDPIQCITDRKGYYVVNNNRVIQLKNGRLLMPAAYHFVPEGGEWKGRAGHGRIFNYYSDNNGRSWKSGSEVVNPDSAIHQEPGVIELKNGNVLMLIRTNKKVQYISYSKDKGMTWTPAQPGNIKSPTSPASIGRIPSTGDLLLVWNNNGTNEKRTPLTIAISKDEGKTWEKTKNIEDDPLGTFCYTAIHFIENKVLLSYSNWANMGSKIVSLNLEWIYQ
jgi:sialidase-1